MPNYIRAYLSSGFYFFTVALLEHCYHLLGEYISTLREAFRSVRSQRSFLIEAIGTAIPRIGDIR